MELNRVQVFYLAMAMAVALTVAGPAHAGLCRNDFAAPKALLDASFEKDGFAIGRRGPPLPSGFDPVALTNWATAGGRPSLAQWQSNTDTSLADPKEAVNFDHTQFSAEAIQKQAPEFYKWLMETARAYVSFYRSEMKVQIPSVQFSLRWWPASETTVYYRDQPNTQLSHQDGGYSALSINFLGDRTLYDLKEFGVVVAAPLAVPVEFSALQRSDGVPATWHRPEKPSGKPRFFVVIRFLLYDRHHIYTPANLQLDNISN